MLKAIIGQGITALAYDVLIVIILDHPPLWLILGPSWLHMRQAGSNGRATISFHLIFMYVTVGKWDS
jgi:hypothetical protein